MFTLLNICSISSLLTRLGCNNTIVTIFESFLVFFIFFKIFASKRNITIKQTLMHDNSNKTCYKYLYSLPSVYVRVQFYPWYNLVHSEVSALFSGSRGLGSSPSLVLHCTCRGRHFILTVPLSTQENKQVLAKLMLGVTLQQTSIASFVE